MWSHCSRPDQAATLAAGWFADATDSVVENDRSTLGMACFGSESASSGLIRCQSSGRKSILVTAPPVACSMAAQCSIGIAPRIFQLPIAAADTPSSFASVRRPPASRAAVSSRCSDRGSISVFISMTDFNTFGVFRSTPRDDISSIKSQIVKTIGERITLKIRLALRLGLPLFLVQRGRRCCSARRGQSVVGAFNDPDQQQASKKNRNPTGWLWKLGATVRALLSLITHRCIAILTSNQTHSAPHSEFDGSL